MSEKRQIVNIVNFIRYGKGREAEEGSPYVDYLATTKNQVALMERYKLPVTYLFQYDALIHPDYTEFFKELDASRVELGLWFEIPMELCFDAGLEWTGEWTWDYHCHCNCPIGYTNKERERLVDVAFEKFKEVFGYYPRTVGAWLFDGATARYMCDKYEVDALCNCKEQFGTDGYTLWGGYYAQGYYPSRTNQFLPAQTKEEQLKTPLFRMLGCDPVYQFDSGLNVETGTRRQGVISLEPVYPSSGGNPVWVDWYLRQNFNGECLSFGYTQAGQENAFGWDRIKAGLRDQLPKLKWLHDEGKLTVETMGETGRWYKRTYDTTPASAISCHGAYNDEGKDTVWYNTKNYRINLYGEGGNFRIRDIHVFDENIPCPYENVVCTENSCTFETLPVVDGNMFSGNGILSGVFFEDKDGNPLTYGEMKFVETAQGEADVSFGDTTFSLFENGFEIKSNKDFCAVSRIGRRDFRFPDIKLDADDGKVNFTYNGVAYTATLEKGKLCADGKACSEGGVIRVKFN